MNTLRSLLLAFLFVSFSSSAFAAPGSQVTDYIRMKIRGEDSRHPVDGDYVCDTFAASASASEPSTQAKKFAYRLDIRTANPELLRIGMTVQPSDGSAASVISVYGFWSTIASPSSGSIRAFVGEFENGMSRLVLKADSNGAIYLEDVSTQALATKAGVPATDPSGLGIGDWESSATVSLDYAICLQK